MASERSDPLVFERDVRADGLTVVRQPAPSGSASFAATYVGPAGWAFDPEGREGLAVVTSQVGASAAGRRDRVALARELDQRGGSIHRHCAPETNEVSVTGPGSELVPLLGLLADVVLRPRWATDDLERVRRQIVERQLREQTQPGPRADREMLYAVFPTGHPYRLSGLGSRRSIAGLRRTDLVKFHREQTAASGGFVVVTTSRSMSDVQRLVHSRFPRFPTDRPARAPPAARNPVSRAVARSIAMAGRSQTEIRVGGNAPSRDDPSFPALVLANEVLGGRSLLNRLFQHIREDRGLAYHASSDLESMRWGGYWSAQAGSAPERAEQVVRLMRDELAAIAETPIPAGELNRIRESAIGEIPLGLETSADAHELAVDAAYNGLAERHWLEWPSILRALTPRAIRDATANVYDPARAVTVVAGTVG
ncbi:MAG: insulinase family protein [Thermoplasmata archaeon]|nr:insulinase family protein [Thermoplasmata archaeon]MCI4355987.1 insulinase family protein [Thermoplasmata archaeon]